MEHNNSFKERVRQVAIKQSKIYNNLFVNQQYLICSYDFKENDFYILSGEQTNYLHLVGVNTSLTPKEFFNKCFNGTLEESDFDFSKKNTNPSVIKGSVRRKIQSLELLNNFLIKNYLLKKTLKKIILRVLSLQVIIKLLLDSLTGNILDLKLYLKVMNSK